MIAFEKLPKLDRTFQNAVIGIVLLNALHRLVPGEQADLWWKALGAAQVPAILALFLGKLGYRLLLERTPAMAELEHLQYTWKQKGVYATNRWK